MLRIGNAHKIITFIIERRRIFSDDQDRDNFVERPGDIVTATETFCFAWVLIRSAGGWSMVNAMRRTQDHMKSDERILGDGDFTVLLGSKKVGFQCHRIIKKAWRLAVLGEYFGKPW